MQRRHPEDSSPLPVRPFGGLEHPHLDDHREGFGQEHTTHHQQWPEAVTQQSDAAQRGTHGQGSRVPHEHPCRIAVVNQKAQPGSRHGHAEPRQSGITVVATQHQLQCQAGEDKCTTAAGKAIEAIGEVGGVALGKEHEQPQRPDQQSQR